MQPTSRPSRQPSGEPSRQPTARPSKPSSQPTEQPSERPTRQPTNRPTSQPTRRPVFIKQVILGVTSNTPAFQKAFTSSIMSVLPSNSIVTITSVTFLWSDGSVTVSHRRALEATNRALLQTAPTVVGVQVTFSVVVPQAPGGGQGLGDGSGSGGGSTGAPLDTNSIQALLSDPATVSAVGSFLASTGDAPGAVVQVPLVLVPSAAPTSAPTQEPTYIPSTLPTLVSNDGGGSSSGSSGGSSGSSNSGGSSSGSSTVATVKVSQPISGLDLVSAQQASFQTAFRASLVQVVGAAGKYPPSSWF